jgi:hypothetical protein
MYTAVASHLRWFMIAVLRHGLAILLVASAALNMSLSAQLRESRKRSEAVLQPGTRVPPISGVTTEGVLSTIQFNSTVPTVFYYFSAACGWCERNWVNVEALVRQSHGRYRVIGIAATDETPAALKRSNPTFPFLKSVDPDTLAAYGFRGTPQTVVVGEGGRVLKSWTGAYQGAQAKDISAYFDVQLPGLLPKKAVTDMRR